MSDQLEKRRQLRDNYKALGAETTETCTVDCRTADYRGKSGNWTQKKGPKSLLAPCISTTRRSRLFLRRGVVFGPGRKASELAAD